MNYFKLILGILALTYGIFTIIQRKRKPESFSKLQPMKEKFGDKAGFALHFTGYSLIPIILGVTLMAQAILLTAE